MYGIIDCDNCYVSCERVFRPDLNGKPVVVLSNNDGCVVARSNEAKVMGIKAGTPYFQLAEQFQNSRTPIFDLNISELPLNKKETGNTLETRGLTYSYTFLTKPKNAHLGCKDTKQIPSCQMVSYTFFKFIAIFIFIGIQTTLFGHSNEQNPVCHFTYISVPSHCSHL